MDDAALSCGGSIHQEARHSNRPLVITCFAGVPDYRALSPFAVEQHQRWGQTVDPVEARRREDAAMGYLGADYQQWDYLDCIYRRAPVSGEFLYTSEAALFGPVHSAEQGLINELTTRLMISLLAERGQIYAPLAVGNHVDHQIVFQAALRLRDQGFQVQFYEDYPYVEESQKLALVLQQWKSPPTPVLRTLDEQDLAAKIEAINMYHSQIATLFGNESLMKARVRSYALAVGGGCSYKERYWQGGTR